MRVMASMLLVAALAPHVHAASPTSASDYSVQADALGFGTSVTGTRAHLDQMRTDLQAVKADLARLNESLRLLVVQREGRKMTPQEAEQLEAAVSASPYDVMSRARLVAYYDARKLTDTVSRTRRLTHIYGLIREHPESPAASNWTTMVWRDVDGTQAVEAVSAEWMRQVEGHPGSTVILDHAADAMWSANPLRGRAWLAAGERLTPKDPLWAQGLGYSHYISARSASDAKERYGHASQALAAYERAMILTPLSQDRRAFLFEAAYAAHLVERDDKAERYARDLLKHSSLATSSRADYDTAVNQGNTVLGLIACRKKDLKAARSFLGLSGDVHSSPVLEALGPEFALAAALLERGQRDAVDDYLEACESFWESGRDRLARWRKQLSAGETPDFKQF